MKRYIDFRADDWIDRTDSRMQAARWTACYDGLGDMPPEAGVLDAYAEDVLLELAGEGWVALEAEPMPGQVHEMCREAVMRTLADDVDCLSLEEHTLVERMLIGEGMVALETVPEMEAAYTLRMRMWCDLGLEGEQPVARLDRELIEALPPLLMRPAHTQRRAKMFIFDGMLHALLYVAGYLDDRMPRARFIEEVLGEAVTPETDRLARNYLEASFDTYVMLGCNLLVHEALADPEALAATLTERGAFQVPEIDAGVMAASMNGLLPEEAAPEEKLQRALYGALRPEYEPVDATSDLRFLIKQGAPLPTLQEVMASMLCVLPTPHMEGALRELRTHVPRWVLSEAPPPQGTEGTQGLLH